LLLQELILFLSKFQSATLSLEQFKQPTLHKVVFWRHSLLKHLKVVEMEVRDAAGKVMMSKDSGSIAALKAIILPIFDEKFKIQEIHILATLLDPIMKNKLPGMGIDAPQFKNATESLREKMMSLKFDDDTKSNGNQFGEQDGAGIGCTIARTAPPTAKRQRISSETISMYDACSSDEDGVHDDTAQSPGGGGQLANLSVRVNLEHAAFLDYKVPETEIKAVVSAVKDTSPKNSRHKAEFQVLMWWKLFGTHLFPMIARVARSTLCVCASSAKSENNFSDAGNTLTKKRSNLNPHIVNDMMFVRSNHDICGTKEVD
jgi:hAT family C-terminal dimerisation region